ncbi:uncharacterized protein MELLADRAFT_54665, partial [Melampsora larici-populina 98AG31]
MLITNIGDHRDNRNEEVFKTTPKKYKASRLLSDSYKRKQDAIPMIDVMRRTYEV